MRTFNYAGGNLHLGTKTYIMGILNITPDSFYDGGRFFDPKNAVKRAVELENEGADILDIGAVSTRPGAIRVSEAEEMQRLRAVFKEIRKNVNIPISVDTYRPSIANFCLNNGANIINDVSGAFNPLLAKVIKDCGAGWIVMHSGGDNVNTEDVLDYPCGIVNHIQMFFDEMLNETMQFGIDNSNICLDAGFGFAKTNEQNIELLKNFDILSSYGCALLCALSRKRFIGELFCEVDPEKRINGTLVANITAVLKGADIIRVHNVNEHKQIICGLDKIVR
ncbi:MAG: dihydropteroate synthase [Oscillospiraceae bacterium]|nr:dihydropteroate synthase [Oscillospiraceae bacterium]